MTMPINVNYVYEYYGANNARELSHKAKKGDVSAIKEIAFKLSKVLPPSSTLVPAPSRHGYATETLILARYIAENIDCKIADVIKGKARNSLYESKKNGIPISNEDFEFVLTGEAGPSPIIIDFVFATGFTAASIAKRIPNSTVSIFTRDSTVDLIDSTLFKFNEVQELLIPVKKMKL